MSVDVLKKFKNTRCWSSFDDQEINRFFNSDASNFKSIVALALGNEKDYSWRAAWLLARVLNKDDKRLILSGNVNFYNE